MDTWEAPVEQSTHRTRMLVLSKLCILDAEFHLLGERTRFQERGKLPFKCLFCEDERLFKFTGLRMPAV